MRMLGGEIPLAFSCTSHTTRITDEYADPVI
jgi:hypothetical protein